MFFCLSVFVTLWNDEVCNNGNAMKQCNFQNNYGVIAYTGRFIIVHLYSTISVNPRIFPWGKLIPKITILRDFGGCKPTVFKPQR